MTLRCILLVVVAPISAGCRHIMIFFSLCERKWIFRHTSLRLNFPLTHSCLQITFTVQSVNMETYPMVNIARTKTNIFLFLDFQ